MSTGAIPPSYPMLSLSPPPLNLSQHWGFSSKLILHIRWTYWSFSFSISPSNEYSGLISFSCLVGSPCSPRDSQEYSPAQQFESINSSAFTFIYSPTLNIHTWLLEKPQLWLYGPLLAKWCLFFFIHCRFVIAFFPMSKCFFFLSKCLLISWLQSPSAVTLEPKKIKSVSTFPPSICYEVMGPDAMILFFFNVEF